MYTFAHYLRDGYLAQLPSNNNSRPVCHEINSGNTLTHLFLPSTGLHEESTTRVSS